LIPTFEPGSCCNSLRGWVPNVLLTLDGPRVGPDPETVVRTPDNSTSPSRDPFGTACRACGFGRVLVQRPIEAGRVAASSSLIDYAIYWHRASGYWQLSSNLARPLGCCRRLDWQRWSESRASVCLEALAPSFPSEASGDWPDWTILDTAAAPLYGGPNKGLPKERCLVSVNE